MTRCSIGKPAITLSTSALLSCLSVFFMVLALSGNVFAEKDLSELLKIVPDSANAIIAVDADRLRNSPMGKEKNWTAANEAAYVSTPFLLPPESNLLVVASQMNPNQDFLQAWELAVMSLTDPISARAIARAEGGQLDEIAGLPAVYAPNDAYFVNFADDLLAIISPAHRQAVARWIDKAQTGGNAEISPYLADNAHSLLGDSQIVLAMDLANAVIPGQLRETLANSEILKDQKDQLDAWQSVIESLEGVSLAIQVTNKISGRLNVDFGKDPSVLGNLAKDAIIQVFNEHGIAFENIEDWSASQSGNQIRLSGELSESDLRKLMSLLELPSANFDLLDGKDPAGETEIDKIAEASQKYFSSIDTLLKDLENDFRTNRDARRSYSRTYMQRYAKRINELPILNVDSELVEYGLKVAETLRSVSVTQGEANIESGVRSSQVYTSTNRYGYNYSSDRSTSSMRNQIRREEQSVAMNARFGSWKEIQDATAKIRVDMTQKYDIEF